MKRLLILLTCAGLAFACNDEELEGDELNNEFILVNSTSITVTNSDDFELVNVEVTDQVLAIDVRYGGGCEDHVFELVWPEVITAIFPPDFEVILNHDANGDMCEALISQQLLFDFGSSGLGLSDAAIAELRITVINGSDTTQRVSNR